jgi:hypothetical protein
MKEAIIVDLDGRYKEPTIVSSDMHGVTPIYETTYEPVEVEGGDEESPVGTIEVQTLVGHTVAVQVPQGLYMPKFDLEAWDGYHEALIESKELYDEIYADWVLMNNGVDENKDEEDKVDAPMYIAPIEPEFWIEGLTQEEIDELLNAPQPETHEQKIAALESENAFIALELVDTQIRLDQSEQSQADLLLLLVGNGVL